jgi:hypothetical protein
MIKNELITRSPLRIMEQSIHGGMGKGGIGVIAARKGIGKTACLVHIATDRLFQGKHVIHASFCSDTKHIVSWYEDIFNEIARRSNLSGAMDVHDDIIKNRIIMNFKQDSTHIDKIKKNIRLFLENGNFCVDTLVVDGYNFNKARPEDFREFKLLAVEHNLELWFSASLKENETQGNAGIPNVLAPFIEDIEILIFLEPRGDFVHLALMKDHDAMLNSDLHLKLDPHILLIAEENEGPRR